MRSLFYAVNLSLTPLPCLLSLSLHPLYTISSVSQLFPSFLCLLMSSIFSYILSLLCGYSLPNPSLVSPSLHPPCTVSFLSILDLGPLVSPFFMVILSYTLLLHLLVCTLSVLPFFILICFSLFSAL